jgi:hypothetical protein
MISQAVRCNVRLCCARCCEIRAKWEKKEFGYRNVSALAEVVVWSLNLNLKLICERQSVRRLSGTRDQFFFVPEISFRLLQVYYFVAHSLTRGRVCNLMYNCFWSLPEQSLLDRSSAELEINLNSIYKFSSYPTENTLRLRYWNQPVNGVWGNSRCLLWESYGTHRYSSYLIGNTLRICYREQVVNAVWGNSRYLLWEPYGTHRYSSYLIGNTLRLYYREQVVNAVWGNSRCLLWEPYGTHMYSPYLTGTQYVPATETNRLMLFGETVAVYFESHTEHTYTVRTSQERNTPPLQRASGECCLGKQSLFIEVEVKLRLWELYWTYRHSPYLTGNTLRLHYRAQPVNAVWGNSRCLFWES